MIYPAKYVNANTVGKVVNINNEGWGLLGSRTNSYLLMMSVSGFGLLLLYKSNAIVGGLSQITAISALVLGLLGIFSRIIPTISQNLSQEFLRSIFGK